MPDSAFVDYVALLYHEARNVRHLVKLGAVSTSDFARLIALPTNKYAAWSEISRMRTKAASGKGEAAIGIFESAYGVTLGDLAALFARPEWKNNSPGYGGNRWTEIAKAVQDLRDVLAQGDSVAAAGLETTIKAMKHNTGIVGDKLSNLNSKLPISGSHNQRASGPP